MPVPCPPIDERKFEDVVQATESLATRFTNWSPGDKPDLGSALVRIFGRMATQVIDRVNKMPDRHFLAFLNLIGVEPLPSRPARVPLTFGLVEGVTRDVLVPAGSRIAAKAIPGDKGEVIFETTNDLIVNRSKLVTVAVHDPADDQYTDCTGKATGQEAGHYEAFEAKDAIDHVLYVAANEVLTLSPGKTITTTLTFADGNTQGWINLKLEWSFWNGQQWTNLPITFKWTNEGSYTCTFDVPSKSVAKEIRGYDGHWIRIRLTKWPQTAVPAIVNISFAAVVNQQNVRPDATLWSGRPIDTGMDFFPLGEQPKFNDTFYLASNAALGRPGATITLNLTKSIAQQVLDPNDNPTLAFEVWDGKTWVVLGKSTKAGVQAGSLYGLADETKALTMASTTEIGKVQHVTFTLPQSIAATTIHGIMNYWLRSRLVAGNYGTGIGVNGNTVIDNKYRPPVLESATLDFQHSYTVSTNLLISQNGTTWAEASSAEIGNSFVPFTQLQSYGPTLYLGFDRSFAAGAMTLYFQVAPIPPNAPAESSASTLESAEVAWECLTAEGWAPLEVQDDTEGFLRSGILRILTEVSFVPSDGYGAGRTWIRAYVAHGEFARTPRLGRILVNTMWATHTSTIKNEILGSSQQIEGQTLKIAFTPILEGQRIEVREPGTPTTTELAAIAAAEGPDAVTVVPGTRSNTIESWVRWHAVSDFQASGPDDRHYVIDRATGELQFGDGRHGKLPPRGIKNVRATWYQTGGGTIGNRAAGNVNELKSAIPYIASVVNIEAASGGADAGDAERFKDRASRMLRHRNRAIAVEDFEDLACEASPEVARARAVAPTFDPIKIADDDDSGNPIQYDYQPLQLIIVPKGTTRCPSPTVGLLRDVETYVRARCSRAASFILSGPEWVQATVTTSISLRGADGADATKRNVIAAIEQFLHPLTGGVDGTGWAFGRLPHKSDLYPVIIAVNGVDHVRSLTVENLLIDALPENESEEPTGEIIDSNPGAAIVPRPKVLVFSGSHIVEIVTSNEDH